ncbi:hypothetical protein QBC40DRAFT_302688 [Triangularia verruculosa]|uniref:Uncharacterized protein n=1 Tax=Triangularia verruculosa TaxID=2587418 RepID=A0AAN6XTE0_9PEZI|nr:hypothetical protein QBC40DRAFT_302688 [Triangularia verruculosa]
MACYALNKESVNADIRSYVTAQLFQQHEFGDLSQDLLEEIRRKKALISLPRNLEETYERIIKRIPVKFKKDAIRLLQFLVEYKPRRFNIERRLRYKTNIYLIYLTNINGNYKKIKQDFPLVIYIAKILVGYTTLTQASENIVRAIVSNLGPPQGSRLYYIYFVGLIALTRDLISKGADVDVQGGYYGNTL